MPLFDGYIAVDWSAAAQPQPGANGIWIAALGQGGRPEVRNFPTRHVAIDYIATQLTEATAEGRRLLCGFDFAFGFPEGAAQSLTGQDNWEAVWELIANVIVDGANNQNNRFQAAAGLNENFDGEGPFWGRPANPVIQGLGTSPPHNRWGVNLPPHRRHVERVFPGQAVWQLYGRGAVGSQTLMGIARLQALRQHRDDVEIWPFETLGAGQCHVLAEIYPALIERCHEYDVPDAGQVHAVAFRLRGLDAEDELDVRLRAPDNMPPAVQIEEGLFLDIT